MQIDTNGRIYNIVADWKNAYLLSVPQRKQHVPRARKDGVGFGQRQIWYANTLEGENFANKILGYIKNYSKNVSVISNDATSTHTYIENPDGKAKEVKTPERNPKAREECLRIKGTSCAVCGFTAEKEYGDYFEGLIEVHHIIPISNRSGEHEINPITDLIPLCPNCHSAIHKKVNGSYLTIEELKQCYNDLHKG